YLFGNLAAMAVPGYEASWWLSHGANRVQIAAVVLPAAVWLLARRGRLETAALGAMDATFLLVICALYAALVAFPYPEDGRGGPLSRALLAVMMTLVTRAVVVPSSARRTLALGVLAVLPTLAASIVLFSRAGQGPVWTALHTFWSSLWLAGAVVVATL